MTDLSLSEEELELFTSFLDSLKVLTKNKLIEKGYHTFLPSFDIVYKTVVEIINSTVEASKNDDSLSALLSFSMHCSKKLTKNDDVDFNIHAMSVDVYRNLSGEI
ncbi:hypothetical protein [Clostridium perfringens]|uniref:Uncharacterized protein n=1 Tax=Clostridium perfringens TaxID=1502 RepID=A0AAW9IX20_CLOPF|nr:hypothetical protein [Clostridium perfringens]MBI6078370.1 hypothetical protein [Clostridium perfringens]MBI6084007.1 hypothetical protein [Clostridium perfringens]MBI6100391.1 hypothetical protein [Clostridium perfringens]MDZ5031625.1 hypothetical protein [Clostridium perfringens]